MNIMTSVCLEYNKSSTVYDVYKFKLEEKFKKIAETKLNETDEVREKALTQLRALIHNDSRIIDCRMDSNFLLRFLRIKKFNVPATHSMIYRHLKNRQLQPQWFLNIDVLDRELEELLELGTLIIPHKRDSNGRQPWIYNFTPMVPGKHTSINFIRLQEVLYQLHMESEELHIAGQIGVVDFGGFTMKHVTIFPLWDFKKFLSTISKTVPMRIDQIYILNLPRFMQIFYEVGCILIAPKLRQRVKICRSLKEFQESVEIDVFPEKYGGKVKFDDIVSETKEKLYSLRNKIKALDLMRVDLKKNRLDKSNSCKIDSNGNFEEPLLDYNFRMLQVD